MTRSEATRASFLRRCFRLLTLDVVIRRFFVLARAGHIVDPCRFGPVITKVIAEVPDDIGDHYNQCDREESHHHEQDRTVQKPVHLHFGDPDRKRLLMLWHRVE
jgi:hypothetical protein